VNQIADTEDVIAVAAMPDLCPGKYGPVGVAVLASRIHPDWIGSDIGCGFSFFVLDGSARKLRIDKAAVRMRVLGEPWDEDANQRLEAEGLGAAGFGHSLGTVGGGNHFCELQSVAEIDDAEWLERNGISKDSLFLLVHSGSRGLGGSILESVISRGLVSLDPHSDEGIDYRRRHDEAVRWASLNRSVIAERAARALRMEPKLIVDVPHNLLTEHGGLMLHRKGAALADPGSLVPIAGSRGTLSYLVEAVGTHDAMQTLAHGCGRKYDRSSAKRRAGSAKSDIERLRRNKFGGHVICEDKDLLREEAPEAYKDGEKVIGDMVGHGIARRLGTLKPLVTFKTTREERR